MTEFEVIPTCDTKPRTFDTRAEAEQGKQVHVDTCPSCHDEDVMIDTGVDDMDGEV